MIFFSASVIFLQLKGVDIRDGGGQRRKVGAILIWRSARWIRHGSCVVFSGTWAVHGKRRTQKCKSYAPEIGQFKFLLHFESLSSLRTSERSGLLLGIRMRWTRTLPIIFMKSKLLLCSYEHPGDGEGVLIRRPKVFQPPL